MFEIKTLTINSPEYPESLKEIKDPPQILYYRGELKKEEKCLAVVGARRCSSYGKQAAEKISQELIDAGLTIISGLAPGIDTVAHRTAVKNKKRTIAVLGTGLDDDTIYPQENLKLAQEILENGGCLISEYPTGIHGTKFTFPQRNRIISGLSLGVLVVEAKRKSGALITAGWARQQGKKFFAVPGSIYSINSKGCHYLIKKGAKLVESANDILEDLNFNLLQIDFNKIITGENEEENLIIEILKEETLYIDKIIEKTNLPVAKVSSTLANLEIKGKVRNLGDNTYGLA